MKNKNGFTLVELIVVAVIMGILFGIAGISGKAWLDRYRVESQMNMMFSDLMNARISAMQKNRTYFAIFSPSAAAATQYTIYEDTTPAPDGDGELQIATDELVTQTTLNAAYSVTSGAAEIDFNSRGLTPGAVAPLTIRVIGSFGSAYDCLVISVTNIRMGAWDGTSTCVVQ